MLWSDTASCVLFLGLEYVSFMLMFSLLSVLCSLGPLKHANVTKLKTKTSTTVLLSCQVTKQHDNIIFFKWLFHKWKKKPKQM